MWATDRDVAEVVETEIKYQGYLDKQSKTIQRMSEASQLALPPTLDYKSIVQLSNEGREKLGKLRPVTLGHASRIPGITPADMSVLQVLLASHKLPLAEKTSV
jgi:tRNA uridine 5-carboxymethylaminomethyl modification enzyme